MDRIYKSIADTGGKIIHQLEFTGFTLVLILKTFLSLRYVFSKRREIVKQMYISGVKSMPVCTIVALFGGMILALHTGVEFTKLRSAGTCSDAYDKYYE